MVVPTFPRLALSGAILALAGCGLTAASKAEALERQAEMVEKGGTNEEKCRAWTKVADAWLAAEHQYNYELTGIRARLACNRVAIDRLGY